MFEKSNSFSKVLTAALIAVTAVPFITSCGTQQDAVPEKTAAAPVVAPAAAWSDADLQKMLGSIREDNKVRYLVYKNDLIHKQYLEFYEKNKNILTLPQKLTVVMNIVNNAFVLNDPEACKTAVSLFGQLPENEGKQTIRKENARCQIVGGHLGAYSGKNAFVNAEKFYEAEKAFMDPEQKIGLYSGMISQNLRFFGDEQKIDYYLAEMAAVKGSKEIEERLARKKSDTLVNIIQTVAEFD